MGSTREATESKSRWEKLNDTSVWWLAPVMVGLAIVLSESFGFGFTASLVIMAITGIPLMLLMELTARRRRNERLARRAATRAEFECWIRDPNALPDSIRRRWDFGTARLAEGALLFERQLGPDEPPSGKPIVFGQPVHLARRTVPARERRGVPKSWRIVALRTDRGDVDVAASSAEGLDVLGTLEPASGGR
ncbi:hypothetical protein ACX8Z9_04850 [Arthrobacter halodurans]|uniref:Uncharacterized protein n=1 Tax=Arthrobacter halodurans TaxID=516699 RepID=A0ABV4UQ15_9MICC